MLLSLTTGLWSLLTGRLVRRCTIEQESHIQRGVSFADDRLQTADPLACGQLKRVS